MKDIAIFGAGGFGKEVQMLIEQINQKSNKWNLKGFYDDNIEKGRLINELPVLGNTQDLNKYGSEIGIIVAIADPPVKERVINKIKNNHVYYPVLIHPGVLTGNRKYFSAGEGSIITAGNIITVNVEIGRHVILNLSCTVGHDVCIGDYSSIMPGVHLSGEVTVEKGVFIGTGAEVINQLNLGENSIIGAGSVVNRDIPSNSTAVGVPAKVIKKHKKTI
ncbi:MAG: acetyltransferase [Balneolaceae bacterium]